MHVRSVKRQELLARLEREDDQLYRVFKDYVEASERLKENDLKSLRRIYDLRVEIRSWSGRPPPPLPPELAGD
jgi:hypothetical protein